MRLREAGVRAWRGMLVMAKSSASMLQSPESQAVLSRANICSILEPSETDAHSEKNQLMGRNFSILTFFKTMKFSSVFDRYSFLSVSRQQNEWTCSKRILNRQSQDWSCLIQQFISFFMDICACGYDFVSHSHYVDVFSASRSVLLKSVWFHMVPWNISIIFWHSRKNTTTSSWHAT